MTRRSVNKAEAMTPRRPLFAEMRRFSAWLASVRRSLVTETLVAVFSGRAVVGPSAFFAARLAGFGFGLGGAGGGSYKEGGGGGLTALGVGTIS